MVLHFYHYEKMELQRKKADRERIVIAADFGNSEKKKENSDWKGI
jgi:hypothetical protein